MAIIRLIPSSYGRSNTNYVTVTNPSNMYNNTDHTANYATLRGRAGRSNGNSTYYAFINGFNFDAVPNDAVVSGFRVLIKAYRGSYMATGNTNYRICLASQASNSYKIGNTTLSSDITTSTSGAVYEIPTGNLTWNQLVGYGANFSIDIPLRNSSTSSSNYPYVYVYGAEIEVTYSLPNPVNITSVLVSGSGTISPSGTSTHYAGDEYELTITPTNPLDTVTLEFNGTDISSQLEAHYAVSGTTNVSDEPGNNVTTGFNRSGSAFYQSSSTQSDAWLRYAIGHSAESPYSTSNTSNTYVKDGTNDANTMGWMNYPFDFSSIPANAEITNVNVKVYGATESTSQSASHADVELYSGTTLKSTRQTFTSTNNGIMTISDPGEWTRAELQNAQLRFIVGYYGGRILGATWTVTYGLPSSNPEYYTYTYTVSTINTILLEVTIGSSAIIEPPEEDPQYTYWPITISSINATTNPASGTTRVVEGTNQTITITPSDPQLTLALDNGVDLTNQLQGNIPSNTYTVANRSTTYGFALNGNGYYESNNQGQSNSAAVARVTFTLETPCLVTFSYINYAEATYDYGIFGQIDTALGTTYTADSGAYHTCNASSSNTSAVQTLTYEISAGTHYIDIKYRKDQMQDDNNDSLQWKISSIESTTSSGDYTYTVTNIHEKHSLIFVFGNVNYYFITSSGTSGAKLFPDGQQVKLEGDGYKLTIIPDAVNSTISITDNGNNVTSSLTRVDGYDKNNQPIINYTCSLSNITANHTLMVSIGGAQIKLYVKQNGTWVAYSKAYKKINGSWVEQDITGVFNTNTDYRKGN